LLAASAPARVESVSPDQDRIGTLLEQHLFNRFQHAADVGPMAAAADPQVKGRLRNAQLSKELIRHRRIKVLTGMQDALHDWPLAELGGGDGAAHGSRLYELGPRPHHGEQLQRHQATCATAWATAAVI